MGLRLTLDQPRLEDDVPHEGLEHQGGDARMVTVGSSPAGLVGWSEEGGVLPFRVASTACRDYKSSMTAAAVDVEGGIPRLSFQQRKV